MKYIFQFLSILLYKVFLTSCEVRPKMDCKERTLLIFKAINRGLKHFAYSCQEMFFFSVRMCFAFFSRRIYVAETMEQMYLIGIGSLFLIVLTGIFAGQGFAFAFSMELIDFGAKNYLGRIMSISIIRELGPVLTGLMMAARVASGITAEIGAMKASNQIDAMVAFGIDPLKKLAVPRMIALIVMVPALTILCDIIALIGGWVVSIFITHVTSTMYWSPAFEKMVFGNLFIGIVKPIAFSFVIAFVACYKGFTSEGGTKGVGKATTESVVLSSILILLVNFIITKFVFGLIKGYL